MHGFVKIVLLFSLVSSLSSIPPSFLYSAIVCMSIFVPTSGLCLTDMMFVSTMLTIRYFNLSEVDGHGTYIPLTNVSQLGAVDYDPTEEYVYWADKNQAVIARAKLNGSGTHSPMLFLPASRGVYKHAHQCAWHWPSIRRLGGRF